MTRRFPIVGLREMSLADKKPAGPEWIPENLINIFVTRTPYAN